MQISSISKSTSCVARINQSVWDYKFWIAALSVNYVFLDFVRRLFRGEQKLLVFLDVSILAIFLLFFYRSKIKLGRTLRLSIFQFSLILYIGAVIIQVANFSTPDFVTTLAGLRAYLLPIPFIWIGYHVASQEEFSTIEKFAKVLLSLAVISIGFGCYIFFSDALAFSGIAQSLISPMGHGAHSFGDSNQELMSSFFASSSRFSTFLLISYLLIWGVWKLQGKSVLLLFTLFLVGFWVSGSRTGFSIFMLFNIVSMFFFHKRAVFLLICIGVFTGAFYYLVDTVYSWGTVSNESAVIDRGLSVRIDYMIDDFGQYIKRVEQALPLSRVKLANSELIFGIGLGKYGQEALLSPAVASDVHKWYQTFFEEKYQYPSEDSGFVKIIIELGLIGALIFFLFFGIVILLSLIAIARSSKYNDYLTFAIGWFPTFWLALFIKGHPILSDIFVSSFLYMSIGFILAGTHYQYRKSLLWSEFN